ncbi:UDP-glycosyltransferase 86A1-like [Primulina eburnea]|uniref:UDP-glycosyltransferase 86A1-like n=1 Tax=Primulina eburnea TaxID=1245227 RepID=UPI003C6C3E35
MAEKPHAIMIAFPYQGHITPFVNLALKLASKGFAITFVHTHYIHHTISSSHDHSKTSDGIDFFSEARESGLDIRYATISDGFPLEFDRALHIKEYWDAMLRDFPGRVDEFVGGTLRQSRYGASFLIADTFYSWPATVANKYNLISVSFWTQPAAVFSINYHLDLLIENGHFPLKDNINEEINYIPGVGSISTRDLMPYLKEDESAKFVQKVISQAFNEVKKADFILFNTIQELETETLSALNQKLPTYAVGPVNFFENLTKTAISKSLRSESDCSKWLESKPPGSVLYVSFGSHVKSSEQMIQEIAHGLILSEANFIWVVRTDIADALPDGFQDDTNGKGLIIPWCDQITVLSHPAVGGFLTHCGWNSVMESIWCGVPMICHPLYSDQTTNRKLVVDDWKVGIDLGDGMAPLLVERTEVSEKIKMMLNNESSTSRCLKQEAKKVHSILQNALEKNGSSEKNFDQFVQDLKTKLLAKK